MRVRMLYTLFMYILYKLDIYLCDVYCLLYNVYVILSNNILVHVAFQLHQNYDPFLSSINFKIERDVVYL